MGRLSELAEFGYGEDTVFSHAFEEYVSELRTEGKESGRGGRIVSGEHEGEVSERRQRLWVEEEIKGHRSIVTTRESKERNFLKNEMGETGQEERTNSISLCGRINDKVDVNKLELCEICRLEGGDRALAKFFFAQNGEPGFMTYDLRLRM